MENKLIEVVKFLQSKQAVLSVQEVNTICQILQEYIQKDSTNIKNKKEEK